MDLIEPLVKNIEKISEVSKFSQVNREQVLILLIACNHLRLYIDIWSSSCSSLLQKHWEIVALLHRSLRRILDLVNSYSCSDWMSKPWIYLALQNETEFQALLEDLSIHVDLLMSALNSTSDKTWTASLQKSAWENSKTLKLGLKSSAAADWNKLQGLITPTLHHSFMNSIDPFELELDDQTPLGHGSFGHVFRTTWLGHPVAVKAFPREVWSGSPFEGEVMVKLRPCHPSVLQVFGWFEIEDKSFLVMELMQQSLASVIPALVKRSSTLLMVEIFLQIAQGMRFVHSKGVIHRDLKPANVLLNYDGNINDGTPQNLIVKVADFGLSKMNFSSCDQHTHLRGTLTYMAPEMLVGDPDTMSSYQRSVDVYSFGILCAEVLTGERPFVPGMQRNTFLQQINKGLRPKLPSNCHPELKKIIELCWETQPGRRPTFDSVCSMLWGVKGLLLTGSPYSVPGSGIAVLGRLMVGEKLTGEGNFVTETFWSACYWVRHLPNGEKVRSSGITEMKQGGANPEYVLNASDLGCQVELVCIRVDRFEQTSATTSSSFAGHGGVVDCSEQYKRRDCRLYKVTVQSRINKMKEWKATLKIEASKIKLKGQGKTSEEYDGVSRIEVPSGMQNNDTLCEIAGQKNGLMKLTFRSSMLRDLAILTMKSSADEWRKRSPQPEKNSSACWCFKTKKL